MNKYFLLIIISIFASIYSVKAEINEEFISIRDSIKMEKNEYLAIFFIYPNACQMCNTGKFQLLLNHYETNDSFKLCTIFIADRDIEVEAFKKKYKWKYFSLNKKYNIFDVLGINPNTTYVVLDYSGKTVKKY